jgi:hypothetical protein
MLAKSRPFASAAWSGATLLGCRETEGPYPEAGPRVLSLGGGGGVEREREVVETAQTLSGSHAVHVSKKGVCSSGVHGPKDQDTS